MNVDDVGRVRHVSAGVRIRHVMTGEGIRLRELRLQSLASDPDGFGSTHAHELAFTAERWEQGAESSERGTTERTFVAINGAGEWLGMAVGRIVDEMPGVAGMYATWVAPGARGGGLARQLCDRCSEWATERGCRELRLWVEEANARAMGAYTSAGFEPIAQDSWTRPDGVVQVHIIMTRRLPISS